MGYMDTFGLGGAPSLWPQTGGGGGKWIYGIQMDLEEGLGAWRGVLDIQLTQRDTFVSCMLGGGEFLRRG